MTFWKRAQSFGFEIPDLGRTEAEVFPGTSCRRLSGTKLMHHLVGQCRTLAEQRYAGRAKPHLAVILAGEHPPSEVYVAHKRKRFAECGFVTTLHRVPAAEAGYGTISALIQRLNADPEVHGILVQLPLPGGLDPLPLLDLIEPAKDVDGFHVVNSGFLAAGRYEGLLPCTPFGIYALLRSYGVEVDGKAITVIGRSNIVGKPAAIMGINARASVSIVHKQTSDILPYTQLADILIVGAGSHMLIRKKHVRPGAVIVDVGIHTTPAGKIEGDVHPEVHEVAAMATPVPGGVGPMTIGMLCVNTAMACWSRSV